jgi:hypothetical protein
MGLLCCDGPLTHASLRSATSPRLRRGEVTWPLPRPRGKPMQARRAGGRERSAGTYGGAPAVRGWRPADIRVHHGRAPRVRRWTFPTRVCPRRALPDEALRGKVWRGRAKRGGGRVGGGCRVRSQPSQGFHDGGALPAQARISRAPLSRADGFEEESVSATPRPDPRTPAPSAPRAHPMPRP